MNQEFRRMLRVFAEMYGRSRPFQSPADAGYTHRCDHCGQDVRAVGSINPVRLICPMCGQKADARDLADYQPMEGDR
jgi:uncharacterized protein (DUF983 family)